MRVASYNIHKCKGVDGQTRPERIVAVLKEIGADLVALQEADRRFGRRVGLLDVDELKRETGLDMLAQSDMQDGHGWHGNVLLVRGEPKHYRRLRLRLPGVEPRGALIVELDLGEGQFRVIACHLGLLRRSRVTQANALLSAFTDLPPMPTILLGDLNEWRRRGRSSLNVFEPMFGEAKPIPSFPSRRPMLPLDRILGWPMGIVEELAVHNTPLSKKASDHLPLTAKVTITPSVAIRNVA